MVFIIYHKTVFRRATSRPTYINVDVSPIEISTLFSCCNVERIRVLGALCEGHLNIYAWFICSFVRLGFHLNLHMSMHSGESMSTWDVSCIISKAACVLIRVRVYYWDEQ